MIFLIVENEKVKFWKESEGVEELSSSWTLGDSLPYQAILRYFETDDYIHMHQIYVKSTERRKGIGKMLMKEVEKIAKEKGKGVKIISTATPDLIFGKFLKKLGYKRPTKEEQYEYIKPREVLARKKKRLG
jgi:GNAT superfamily N-acetyltransferase